MPDSRNQIISDARVLTADYLPNKLVHREGERQEIARNLRPLMEDGVPTDMLLHGPPGTGKTAMAKYVVEELQKEVFVNTSYVNCFSHRSRFEIFYELLDEKLTIPRDSTSTEKVIEKFRDKARKNPTIIIMDEVDQVTEDDVLYELSRFQKAGIIFIANDANTFSHFEDRVRSRISGVSRIRFKRYSKEQLTDILKLRRKHGLRKDCVKTSQLEMIASKAGGDARVAVNTLRLSARKAEDRGLDEITRDIISQAVDDAYDEEELHSLERLNSHQKEAYKILQEQGSMQIGQIYDIYTDRVEDSKSRRQLLRYLKKMESYDILETEGSKSSTTYSLAD